METFSALPAICAGNSPVTGEFPAQRPVTSSFDVFFDLRLNKRLSKQSWGWWFETPSHPLWRHCNDLSICYSSDNLALADETEVVNSVSAAVLDAEGNPISGVQEIGALLKIVFTIRENGGKQEFWVFKCILWKSRSISKLTQLITLSIFFIAINQVSSPHSENQIVKGTVWTTCKQYILELWPVRTNFSTLGINNITLIPF